MGYFGAFFTIFFTICHMFICHSGLTDSEIFCSIFANLEGYGGLLKLFSSCFISEMVDLGGYVIILVETHDKKVKLYGK